MVSQNSNLSFIDRERQRQSKYREKLGEPAGVGPRVSDKTVRGNMLQNGENTGKNFILKETHQYALERVKNKRREETIDSYRLFNNMLSSMPLCFNLFHPMIMMLAKNPEAVSLIFKSLFPRLEIGQVREIKIEYIPENYLDYIGDKTAFDAFVEYSTVDGRKGFIGIEVKYTEGLGSNRASKYSERKLQVAQQSGIFNSKGLQEVAANPTQGLRNILLTEAVRLVDGFDESISVVLAPEGNAAAHDEVTKLHELLLDSRKDKLVWVSLECLVNFIQQHVTIDLINWIDVFWDRYLNFSN